MAPEANTTPEANQASVLGWGTYEAPGLGTLWLVWGERGLLHVSFSRPDSPPSPHGETTVPESYAAFFDRFFAGERLDVSEVPIELSGTDFQLRVWEALRRIPYGDVRTYESIANEIGSPKAMRAVGMANNANPLPIVVPCHRVIEAGHQLGGYGGGLDRKRFLLELEGAQIDGTLVRPGQLSLF